MTRKEPRGNAAHGIDFSNGEYSAFPTPYPTHPRLRPTPRDYQHAAIEHVLAASDRGETCGLVSLPTGAGKTVVAGEVLRRLGGRALVVAHTSLLVNQLRETFAAYLAEPIGLVLDGSIEYEDARVIFASRQSLTTERIAAIASSAPVETLVFDEAHHAADSSTYAKILDTLRDDDPDLFVLGLTATPWRETGRMLFERWWFSREIADLIPLGVLAPVRHTFVELPLALRNMRTSGRGDRDYNAKALEPALLQVARETAARVAPLVQNLTHVVVFAATVKHAHALAEALERAGVSAAPIWGAMQPRDRDDAVVRWREGEIQALVNVGIVTEGFDEPRISAIVFARPTASTLFYMQALGRGLRIAPAKHECLVVDCVGLGDLRDARQCTLDAIVPEVAALGQATPPLSRQGRRLIAAPGDDRARLWHKIAPDAYALPVDRNEYLFVVRDPSTGLYRASYAACNAVRERFEPAPFALTLPMLRERLRGRKLVFGKRNAQWRSKRATSEQLRALETISAASARRAIAEGWNRGHVASALTTVYARRLARRLGLLNAEAA
jgi:superfamily II DNA or RNA helicase